MCLVMSAAVVGACDEQAPHSSERAHTNEAGSLPAFDRDDEVAFRAGCNAVPLDSVKTGRELVIRNTVIVDDPVRTTWNGSLNTSSSGVWHFGRLMTQMAGDRNPSDFVRQWLETWSVDRPVNGQTIPARSEINDVLAAWPKKSNGELDLTKAPFRLLAIVNRVDLAGANDAGEGRFVFGLLDTDGSPLQFTVILEYDLPLSAMSHEKWTEAWHELSSLNWGSSAYKQKLQALTQAFARKNAMPARPNGSAISQVRTNEIALDAPWELREFLLKKSGVQAGLLKQRTVALTPRNNLDGTARLGRFINQNEDLILEGRHGVPFQFEGAPFRSGGVENSIDFWSAPNVADNEARHRFSLSTCNGCHGAETGTDFLHIRPREAGKLAGLSAFMTGTTVQDPVVPSVSRNMGEFQRRQAFVRDVLCDAQ